MSRSSPSYGPYRQEFSPAGDRVCSSVAAASHPANAGRTGGRSGCHPFRKVQFRPMRRAEAPRSRKGASDSNSDVQATDCQAIPMTPGDVSREGGFRLGWAPGHRNLFVFNDIDFTPPHHISTGRLPVTTREDLLKAQQVRRNHEHHLPRMPTRHRKDVLFFHPAGWLSALHVTTPADKSSTPNNRERETGEEKKQAFTNDFPCVIRKSVICLAKIETNAC